MNKIAVLDKDNRLIGVDEVGVLRAHDVQIGRKFDLPLDGSYKWVPERKAFLPLGAGFNKPPAPPIDFLCIIRWLIKLHPDEVSSDIGAWVAWYDEHQSRQIEERAAFVRKRSGK